MFADEVIGLAGEGVEPAHERLARRTHETHADHGRLRWRLRIAPLGQAARVAFCIRVWLGEYEHGLARGEIKAVAGPARDEAHVLVRLALIRLEVKRQPAVALAYTNIRSPGCWGRSCWQGEGDENQERQEEAARRDERILEHDYLPHLTDRQPSGGAAALACAGRTRCSKKRF